jgi:hypothetical protein
LAAQAETVATNAPLCADSIGADRTEPEPNDATEGPCLNLMVHNSGPSMPRSRSSGDVVPAPGSLGAADSRVSELGLLGYPGSPFLPISWRQVENSVEQACSCVATMDKLLRGAMAMVG